MLNIIGAAVGALVLLVTVLIGAAAGAVQTLVTGAPTAMTCTLHPSDTQLMDLSTSSAAPSITELIPRAPTTVQRSLSLSGDQLSNAAIIMSVGKGMGLPPRAWLIAIATALQESGLHNLDHGDRDSLGLFQQRPSQGWGTPAQVMDPAYAASKFYSALQSVINHDPSWQTEPLTQIAQAVQNSGFPNAYAPWEQAAANAVLAVGSASC